MQQPANIFRNRAADFNDQPSARPQDRTRLRDQPRDHLSALRSGKHGVARLELAHLKLHTVRLRFANIRRIRNDEVERSFQSMKQIGLMELNPPLELMPRSVGP